VHVDPEDSSRVQVIFELTSGTPVKTDSVATITSLSALGDNYLEITPGGRDAPLLGDGDTVPSRPYTGLNDVVAHMDALTPDARQLLVDLNQTVLEMKDLLNGENRGNVAASLDELRSLLEDSRPKVSEVLSDLRTASSELPPLLKELRETTRHADESLAELGTLVKDGRPDVEQAVRNLRETSEAASRLVDQLNHMFIANAGGIDEAIDNLRIVTENLKQFTDLIKTRPASLIRTVTPEDRKPGEPPKK
jgi:phospholipid/cholesterol/gamma-HCH transport system substrate-binding protein